MPSIQSLLNESASVTQLPEQTAITSFQDQERLSQVLPSIQPSSQTPSPPSHHIFNLPSLLDCLSEPPLQNTMPPPLEPSMSPSDSEDEFDAMSFLLKENQSDETTITSTVCAESASEDQEYKQILPEDEINSALLRDDFQSEIGNESDNDDLDKSIDDSTVAYCLGATIEEARSHFGEKIPDFCIKRPEKTVRKVVLVGNDDVANIHFQRWSDDYGYWSLTDAINDTYILKCINNKYHVWNGVEDGFDVDPTASIFKVGKPSKRSEISKSIIHDLRSTAHTSLRPRTARQSMPYTMYNAQKKFDDRGMRLTENELEDVVLQSQSPPAKKSRRNQKRKRSESVTTASVSNVDTTSTQSRVTSTMIPVLPTISVSDAHLCENTVFRTKFHGFERATIPISARGCFSNEALFIAINKKWAFKLKTEEVAYCVASFAWLDADKNILLQQCDNDAFQSLTDQIKQSPV